MRLRQYLIGIVGIVLCIYFIFRLFTAPSAFPINQSFIVNEGESLSSVSARLESEGYTHSALVFRIWVSFGKRDRHVQLGEYFFDTRLPLALLVDRLTLIGPTKPLVAVTIPEGSTDEEVANLLASALPLFSKQKFLDTVIEKKATGILFPSTYFLLPSTTESKSIEILTDTFDKEYSIAFGTTSLPSWLDTKRDLISLAAILEGEAKGEVDMKIVSGILKKRLEIGMPLQVDVALETYARKGIPARIINNPGIVAMRAVIYPTESPYLYYITGNDGNMYYAKTYDEHKKNIDKYLR